MRALLAFLLLGPLPALGQAQAVLDARGEPLPWPEPIALAAPVRLVTDTLWADEDGPRLTVYAEGADGRRVALFERARRGPARVFHDNGWVELTQGCGRDCFVSYLVDRERGRVAGPLALVLDVDVVRDRIVAAGAAGLVVLDPFDPASALGAAMPEGSVRFGPPLAVFRHVAFLLGEDALAVTVVGASGEEASFVVPLDGGDALTTLPGREAP
jgi:hypothetical protein